MNARARTWTNPLPQGTCQADKYFVKRERFEAKLRRILDRCESLALDNPDDKEELITILVQKLGPK